MAKKLFFQSAGVLGLSLVSGMLLPLTFVMFWTPAIILILTYVIYIFPKTRNDSHRHWAWGIQGAIGATFLLIASAYNAQRSGDPVGGFALIMTLPVAVAISGLLSYLLVKAANSDRKLQYIAVIIITLIGWRLILNFI